ncbi:hypothetical protein [Methylobacterium gnaphalii]|uniref:Uncharacterized protein n=1 Tax=Methylobacterium gnaphalii TaxID=1010610 RepID=A0A512JMQ3_9HYPH|nr:hypothetical protein [Methylobacterium gnaphalii]GEP11250.1 hypothetical protein MGN01_30950 [Methylobacterium gnaphalii]GJD71691.1 hypothetical protein MMMDOFMJ_4654 [Methylobacterium gnaphalii]GLS49950.1 hypothetical protein GCM10007885_28020 [Methylobacterium gnaphalii]
MRRVFEFKALWSLVGLVAAAVALAKLVPYQPRGTALRSTFFVVSGWGLFAYWRPFRAVILTRGWPDGFGLYAIMVWMVCASYNLNIAIATFWRLAGQPAFLINNALFDFWIVLGIAAMTIAVTVPDLFGKDVPPRDKIQLGSAWTVMFALVLYLTIVHPDLGPLADWLRPYIDSGHAYRDPD